MIGKTALYIPICVDGGEWNHVSDDWGIATTEVGDGERDCTRVLASRFFTASDSESSPSSSSSSEDAEPDNESSRPYECVSTKLALLRMIMGFGHAFY